jgi:hypothetical protein
MNIISVSSPKYSKADNSAIDCMVTFDNGKTYPYTAAAFDAEPHGIQLWADLNAGKHGPVAPYQST